MTKRFTSFLTVLLAAVLLTSMPTLAGAQTQVDHTRFSVAVTASANTVTLSAASGAVAGDFVYSEGELMKLLRNTSGTTWTVQRGLGDGMTPARGHSTTAVVWTGGGGEFKTYDVAGTCSQQTERYLPHINTKENNVFDCAATGQWRKRWVDRASVESARTICGGQLMCRDEFNQGYIVFKDDGTAKALTDNSENVVIGSPLGAIEYREEANKTTASWVTVDGQLDISADDTTASEGVEIVWGSTSDSALNQLLEIGTNGGCLSAMVTIAKPSAVTQLMFGWRQNEAFQDLAAYDGYTRWNTVGLSATDAIVRSKQEVNGGTLTDASTVTWADAERRALKVCMSSGGVPSAYISAASPDSEAPIYTPITMTNSGTTQTSGTGMIPFMTFLAAGTTDAGVTIQWVQLDYAP